MPKKEQSYIVEGFAFKSEKEAEQAKKEQEGIRYVKEKIDRDNYGLVLQIYNKMIRENMFVTSVGYAYLFELQESLRANPAVADEDILPITVVHPALEESLKEEKKKHQRQLQKLKKKSEKKKEPATPIQKKYKISLAVNVILAVSIAGMFLISATSSHPTILNYEKELINRYSAWEQELTEREAVLREAEKGNP